jgi:CBS domain containing-hemolysin-like protein
MSLPLILGLLVVLIVGSAFFSGSETALLSARRARLETLAREGRRDARVALDLVADAPRTIAAILVGTNLCNVGASALATALAVRLAGDRGPAFATLLLTPIVLVAGEILPKAYFRHRPTRKLRAIGGSLRASRILFAPAVAVTSGATRILLAAFGVPASESGPVFRREDLESLFAVGPVGSGPDDEPLGPRPDEETALAMAGKALDLKGRLVRDAMVPLPAEWTCPMDATVDEARERFRAGRARFLTAVDAEGRIEGFVAPKHLLGLGGRAPIAGRLRPALLLGEDEPLDAVLRRLRRHQHGVGAVRGRDGRTLGVLTPEDVFEEVVGELRREAPERPPAAD